MVSHCERCDKPMHPIDAEQSLVCRLCRRALGYNKKYNVRSLKTQDAVVPLQKKCSSVFFPLRIYSPFDPAGRDPKWIL